MGGCGSRPRDLDDISETAAPAPIEIPAADVPAVAEAETAPQETKKEEPLVDISEPAPVVAEETKVEAAVPAEETKPVEEEKKVVA